MLLSNVNRNGKKPRENRSMRMARRKRCWAGVSFGLGGSGGGSGGCMMRVS